jgi:hypothetical protein
MSLRLVGLAILQGGNNNKDNVEWVCEAAAMVNALNTQKGASCKSFYPLIINEAK